MKKMIRFSVAALTLLAASGSAMADWTSYVVREGGGSAPIIQSRDDVSTGAMEFITSLSGQKAAWSTNDVNGCTVGDLASISIERLGDNIAVSGAPYGPYINIWVTDGSGNYAIVANEPSNAEWQPGNMQWDMTWDILKTKTLKVYETVGAGTNTSWVNTLTGKTTDLTFEDVSSLIIEAPSVAYIAAGNGVGTGAPDELGTNIAYGFNWVFGDTLANYVTIGEGYIVANPIVTCSQAVPAPGAVLLSGLGISLAGFIRRRA